MTGYGRTGRELSQSGTPSRAGRGGVLWRPALLRVPLLRGSTLVETLVMMLVAGIVFLTVMDGMTLFTRLQVRRAEDVYKRQTENNVSGRLGRIRRKVHTYLERKEVTL